MFRRATAVDDRTMTAQHSVPRRLHRRSDERVIAGVASGLGDYFNVDPLLIRIALVASLVFGGLGIFLYAAAWLLVPDDTSDRSVAERIFGGAALGGGLAGGMVVVVGIIVVLGVVSAVLGGVGDSTGGGGALALAIVIGLAGLFLLRRGSPAEAGVAPAPEGDAATAVTPAAPVARRARRPASPLGWYVLGAALIAVGAMALAGTVADVAFAPGTYGGVVLAIIGLGLLIGAWVGHARFLIVIGLLLLPFAWGASLIDMPIRGAWGNQVFTPSATTDIREAYHVAGGRLVLDLSRIETNGEPVTVSATVAMGELRVLVPDGATVEMDATLGAGTLRLLDGADDNGTDLDDHLVVGSGAPDFILDLDAGIGTIRVDARFTEAR
jgi:phage shock protein PspC (stress-responsive transcriptional regulator)